MDPKFKIYYFQEVSSTMDIARDFAREGCPEFTVIVAARQNAGRGRLKRAWISSEGGLYFTVVLRPEIGPELSFRINFCASLSLARTLQKMFGIPAMVKWPNDILVNDKKIMGMLSEMELDSHRISFINIGIGINVNNDPTFEEPNASSLKKILNREVSKEELLAEFLNELKYQTKHSDMEQVIPEWKKHTMTIGQHVRVVTTHDMSEGLATDVDENGALLLKLEDGSIKKVLYGDCFHQG